MLSVHSNWQARGKANRGKQNSFLFCFSYQGVNFIDKQSGWIIRSMYIWNISFYFDFFWSPDLSCDFVCERALRSEISTFYCVHLLRSVVRNRPNFGSARYSACVVYTETIIHLSVSESGTYLPRLRLISANQICEFCSSQSLWDSHIIIIHNNHCFSVKYCKKDMERISMLLMGLRSYSKLIHWIFGTGFFHIFSSRATSFHGQAKRFKIFFFRCSNQAGKLVCRADQFAWCLALN